MTRCSAFVVSLFALSAVLHAQTLRAPSTPLVVHDPYFSVWSSADRPYDVDTTHWTGKRQAITCLVRIDGQPYRLLGTEPATVAPLPQKGRTLVPTRTVYSFGDDRLILAMTFTTPVLPGDLDLLSRPVTYVHWNARVLDSKPHHIEVQLDVLDEIAVHEPSQRVTFGRETVNGLAVLRAGSLDQAVLERSGDGTRIDWGQVYLAGLATEVRGASLCSATAARAAFVEGKPLPADDANVARPANERDPALVLRMAFDATTPAAKCTAMIAYDEGWTIRYMDQDLRPYWRRRGMNMGELLSVAARDMDAIEARAHAFDSDFASDLVLLGCSEWVQMCSLAWRQAIGGCTLAADANGRPLLFPKENTSNGCVATVDVIHPMAPLFLATSSDLSRAMLIPVLDYASSPRWTFPFAPHDLGVHPHATGQVYGGGEHSEDDQMPVEESADMLLLVASLARQEGNASLAEAYWPVLSRWAAYLKEKGFDPAEQLCTDDFTGHLAHNVNLSCKAILALGAWSQLCAQRGLADDARAYRASAEEGVRWWMEQAADGDHTRLAFDKPGTWSQKYNLVWDRVLELGLFPPSVAQSELAFYRKHQNAFGLPLDSRADFSKLDWITWTACITGVREDFDALIKPAFKFLSETTDRVPMSDWYETKDGRTRGMFARPVVGGVFMRALCSAPFRKKWFGLGARSVGAWAPMPLLEWKTLVATSEKEPMKWRTSERAPAADWTQPAFDDTAWTEGQGGFGTKGTPGAVVRSEWKSTDLWLRRAFELQAADLQATDLAATLRLRIHHDEDAEVYVNGVLAATLARYTTEYVSVPLSPEALATLHAGRNVLAIHCHQTSGGQYIDAGLVKSSPPHGR